jgi:UDP-2-acetamido-2,6-beta-L-arabino-hexul-4-ose reductase
MLRDEMIRVGITGQDGFIGSALASRISLLPEEFHLVPFRRELFDDETELAGWVASCDAIVHLAAVNRDPDSEVLYETNVRLCRALAAAVRRAHTRPHIVFSSSIQEALPNRYGQSKQAGRELLRKAAAAAGASFTGLVIPNVFGPFGKPGYNSVVATFCDQICRGLEPRIHVDSQLKLIYVDEVALAILAAIRERRNEPSLAVTPTSERLVSELLAQLRGYGDGYLAVGAMPELRTRFDVNLFNTFRSYINQAAYFPRALTPHVDARGAFVELLRSGSGGQFSFSSSLPGVTRGNHFHTRKVERFIVIAGRAVIQLRKFRSAEVLEFELHGEHPSYVDMPIWYTHNIRNTGGTELLTAFWVNELFDPADSDTFAEAV